MPRPLARRARAGKGGLPEWISPQLTALGREPPDGPGWLHEIKFDGYRMHARLDRDAVKLLTRTGRITAPGSSLPESTRIVQRNRRLTSKVDSMTVLRASAGVQMGNLPAGTTAEFAKKAVVTGAVGGLAVTAVGGDQEAVRDAFLRSGGMVLVHRAQIAFET
jgi:hypothetical protein